MEDVLIMLDEFSQIALNEGDLSGNSILKILKRYASTVSVFDMMAVSGEIMEENKYVQENYREESQKSYVKAFLCRVNEIVRDANDYPKLIDKTDFKKAIETLKLNNINSSESKSKFPLMGSMSSIYTTFLLEEPIHEVGTLFPGSLRVEQKNGKFYCPVRDANIDTPNAVCNICLAEQLDF